MSSQELRGSDKPLPQVSVGQLPSTPVLRGRLHAFWDRSTTQLGDSPGKRDLYASKFLLCEQDRGLDSLVSHKRSPASNSPLGRPRTLSRSDKGRRSDTCLAREQPGVAWDCLGAGREQSGAAWGSQGGSQGATTERPGAAWASLGHPRWANEAFSLIFIDFC